MLISLQNSQKKLNIFFLYLLVVTITIGPLVYIGVASLYHFVILGLLAFVLCLGIHTADFKTNIMRFLLVWVAEALVSVLWAPDRMSALRYVYYIFLIFGICVLFHCFLCRENLITFSHFMVVVLLICNLIAFWEMRTGNHLLKNYLSTPSRLRLLKFVPGGFYLNPNDFATFIIQIIPFSFAGAFSSKRAIRILSAFNFVASFVTICATQSRTQIILLLGMFLFYMLAIPKRRALAYGALACAAMTLLYFIDPDMKTVITKALESVSGEALLSIEALEGASVSTRMNLMKNAGHILLDTFGFGIGAGCHRSVMSAYSAMYFDTRGVEVMHNLLGELFADYGIIVGALFVVTIISACRSMLHIYKTTKDTETHEVRILSLVLLYSFGMFAVCGMSSSSILQLSSVWLTFCFTSVFIKLFKQSPKVDAF